MQPAGPPSLCELARGWSGWPRLNHCPLHLLCRLRPLPSVLHTRAEHGRSLSWEEKKVVTRDTHSQPKCIIFNTLSRLEMRKKNYDSPAFCTCSSLLACSRIDLIASSEPASGVRTRAVMLPGGRERGNGRR